MGCYTFNVSSSTVMGYMHALRVHLCSFIYFLFYSSSIKISKFRIDKPLVKYRLKVCQLKKFSPLDGRQDEGDPCCFQSLCVMPHHKTNKLAQY